MKRRVILHIGIRKTGTTTIQRFLAANAGALLERGIHYPNDVMPDDRADFNRLAQAIQLDAPDADELWQQVIAEIERVDATVALISAEAFRHLNEEKIQRVVKMLDAYEVSVIVYLRNGLDSLVSSYKQWVKMGQYARSFHKYAERNVGDVDFNALLKLWESAFGTDRVEVRIFDRVVIESDMVSDFLGYLGVPDLAPANPPRRANVSPRDRMTNLLLALNRLKNLLLGKKRKSRLFRVLRESARRRGVLWRGFELFFRRQLMTENTRRRVRSLIAEFPIDRLSARLGPDDIELLRK